MTRAGYTTRDLDDPRFRELEQSLSRVCKKPVQILRPNRRTPTGARLHLDVGGELVTLGAWDLPVPNNRWKALTDAAADAMLEAGVKLEGLQEAQSGAAEQPPDVPMMREAVHPQVVRTASAQSARLGRRRAAGPHHQVEQLDALVGSTLRGWMRANQASSVRMDERGVLHAEFTTGRSR